MNILKGQEQQWVAECIKLRKEKQQKEKEMTPCGEKSAAKEGLTALGSKQHWALKIAIAEKGDGAGPPTHAQEERCQSWSVCL